MPLKAKKRIRRRRLECIGDSVLMDLGMDGPLTIHIEENMDLMILDLLSEHQWTEVCIVDTGMASFFRIGVPLPRPTKDIISESIASVSLMMVSSSLSYGDG